MVLTENSRLALNIQNIVRDYAVVLIVTLTVKNTAATSSPY